MASSKRAFSNGQWGHIRLGHEREDVGKRHRHEKEKTAEVRAREKEDVRGSGTRLKTSEKGTGTKERTSGKSTGTGEDFGKARERTSRRHGHEDVRKGT